MSLVNRLSLFALAGLAIVLAGYSVALLLWTREHLRQQTEERLSTALHTLVAAIEVHPTDVEWEPSERRITLGMDDGPEDVRWSVHDGHGQLVDCSDNLIEISKNQNLGPWSLVVVRVRAGQFLPERVRKDVVWTLSDDPARLGLEPVLGQVPPRLPLSQSTAFILTVATSQQPIDQGLWSLGQVLAGVSLGIWGIGAVVCHAVCRRAIRPVTQIADSCRLLGDDPAARLSIPRTHDELADLGRVFNQLLDRLHAAYERQRRFTGDAAHQLRTPLTALLGHVEVALRQERSVAEYQTTLQIVHRRGQHLAQIIESLLFLARAEMERSWDLVIVDLRGWLRDYTELWREMPRADDIQVDGTSGSACWAQVHTGLLGQVLDNLLDNACKYSPAGTPIRVRLECHDNVIHLIVEDHGDGIGPQDLPHLGEPFFRTASSRRRGIPGVGLGLTVARRALMLQGGQLDVDSTLGQGTRFVVMLPKVMLCSETTHPGLNHPSHSGESHAKPDPTSPTGFHADRNVGGDCHHRDHDRTVAASRAESP